MTLTLFTADDYKSKVLSERGGAGQRVGYKYSRKLLYQPKTKSKTHFYGPCSGLIEF